MASNTKKDEIVHYTEKLSRISSLYGKKKLNISFDRLEKEQEVDQELIYFKDKSQEYKGIFVFSFPFFLKELKDDEIKKILGYNFLNIKIFATYDRLKSSIDKKSFLGVSVNDIIRDIYDNADEKLLRESKILERIFTMAYYYGWDIQKDKNSIDTDYLLIVPSNFRKKPKQRFNLDIAIPIIDNEKIMFFVNMKGDLCFVFKDRSKFSKEDVEKVVLKYLKREFGIEEIEY